ncbi:hypothetical protein XU18_3378 [Perkinsela sp. CCAP 1560/4]|nr:hypothetical protein XU18_3378 [Perkinsela sp. CCAP 1560/4]|eukprot:KNH05607.1 hypothetical protein XU18_3378 [Perkinsela sp. CCAP 1560/4]
MQESNCCQTKKAEGAVEHECVPNQVPSTLNVTGSSNLWTENTYTPYYPYSACYSSSLYPPENTWNYDMMGQPIDISIDQHTNRERAFNGQIGITLEPSTEEVTYPFIIDGNCEERKVDGKKTLSYAQIAKRNRDHNGKSAASRPALEQPSSNRSDGVSSVNMEGNGTKLTCQSDVCGLPHSHAQGGHSDGYPFSSLPYRAYPSPMRRKITPREHHDYTELFEKRIQSPLTNLFIGCQFKELKRTEDQLKQTMKPHFRQELTIIALPELYYARHFHELDPIELCGMNYNIALILDKLATATAIIVPFGGARKEHPLPHCSVQCENFASECREIGARQAAFIALEYDNDIECKDVTRKLLSISNGQLNYLMHTPLVQVMKDGVDLTMLYFLIYDCFRSDFVNFEIELRSIREAPLQIVIRTSKKSICKRKLNSQSDTTSSKIDCRVMHGLVRWRDLPDAPVCIICAPEKGRSIRSIATSGEKEWTRGGKLSLLHVCFSHIRRVIPSLRIQRCQCDPEKGCGVLCDAGQVLFRRCLCPYFTRPGLRLSLRICKSRERAVEWLFAMRDSAMRKYAFSLVSISSGMKSVIALTQQKLTFSPRIQRCQCDPEQGCGVLCDAGQVLFRRCLCPYFTRPRLWHSLQGRKCTEKVMEWSCAFSKSAVRKCPSSLLSISGRMKSAISHTQQKVKELARCAHGSTGYSIPCRYFGLPSTECSWGKSAVGASLLIGVSSYFIVQKALW